jgi:putative transposase
MAFVKNWLHCVWGTKDRIPHLTDNKRKLIINHIKSNAKEKRIYIDEINGSVDHIHCLISLDPDQTLSKVIQLIKGESSFWINKNKLTRKKFAWAVEYFGVSVSESQLKRVRHYIKTQEAHHRIKTWGKEYNELISEYEFGKISPDHESYPQPRVSKPTASKKTE